MREGQSDPRLSSLPEWVTVCDCAGCGRVMLGDSMRLQFANGLVGKMPLAGREAGRPYCRRCLTNRAAVRAMRRARVELG